MARTKQTTRKSTGGKAARKQIHTQKNNNKIRKLNVDNEEDTFSDFTNYLHNKTVTNTLLANVENKGVNNLQNSLQQKLQIVSEIWMNEIIFYLQNDLKSIYSLMLTNKYFFTTIYNNDYIWFYIYNFIFCKERDETGKTRVVQNTNLNYKNLQNLLEENENYYYSKRILQNICDFKYINLIQFRIFHAKNFVNFCNDDYENLLNYDFPIISIYNNVFDNTLQSYKLKVLEHNYFNIYIFGKGTGMPIELQFNFGHGIDCDGDDENVTSYRRILLCEIINTVKDDKKIPILENLMNFNCEEDNLYFFYEYYRMIFILIGEFNLLNEFENIYKEIKENKKEENNLWNVIFEKEVYEYYWDFYNQLENYFGMNNYNISDYFHYNTDHRSITSILRKAI
ncbi:hypothetical protein ABK040_013414 [Willaertia magna]